MISRRDLLKRAATVGSGALVAARGVRAQERTILIAGRPAEVRITEASAVTARITVAPEGAPLEVRGDGALVERAWPAPARRLRARARAETVRCGALALELSADPSAVRIVARARDGRVVQRLWVDAQTGALRFSIGDRPVLGLGEGGPQFDRRGSIDRMRSGQGGYQLRTHGGRVPVPWIIGTSGWALFIHQPYGTFDFTGSEGRFLAAQTDGANPGDLVAPLDILDLFLVGAREPAAVMAEYAKLTGYPEMPPLWSLGYQQSHRTLASPDEILQEARTFREKKLPCDTMIYLGTGFCPSGWNTDNGEFTFNKNVFPDPPRMIQQLHDDHFKVVLHVVLEGKRLEGAVSDRCAAAPLPSGRTPDGHWPDDRQASCYWPAHKPLFDAGVDGWWPDQGDGLDAPSRLARNRLYWDGSRQWRPNERPFALHRNGSPGMQRYAAFLWSGDVYSTWETLKTHVPVAINTGLSGIPYWGTDIGGFVPTRELTGELYVRWFQFASFCPLFRAHGRTWKLRLPWGWNTGDLAPDEISNYSGGAANPDASELHNAAVEPICRKYLELRYQLLPYLYSAVREAHETGLPIIRALWLHYPDDPLAVGRSDEYLWGRDMLVAPVTERAATSRLVYLPRGGWYDFWTEEAHAGGAEIRRAVDLGTLPIFVRGGAILPMGPVKQYTGEQIDGPLALQIYAGADGTCAIYEDDGMSFNHEQGDWMGLDVRWTDRDRRLDMRLAPGSRMRAPRERRITVRLAGTPVTREVTFSGAALQVRL
ncbi:MAG TPA: TIM-barrel domain-containing protein [Vicinamibacterales bacterium]|nr:TIM-barrel domain-containing protein [Vicinamibacterales bacterium]